MMRRRLWIIVVLLVAGLLWFLWPPEPRVVMVGVDGGADYLLDEFLDRKVLPDDGGFAELARRGVRAEAARPVNISVTAPSFASLVTGAQPERHGLMGNTYYRVRDPIGQTRSAFDMPLAAEPLWEPLRRAGKRVVIVGNDIGVATPGQGPNLNLGFGDSDGSSQLAEFTREDFAAAEGWRFGGRRFEQARAARLVFATRTHGEQVANLLVMDTVSDGRERFDRILIDFDRDLSNGVAAELGPGAWAPVRLPVESPTTLGAWVKLLELTPDLSRVRVYLGAVHHNVGTPTEFVERVERGVAGLADQQSFWPGGPDSRALERGWIDEAAWLEQMERLGNYIRDAALWVMAHERFDLMITYQDQVDAAGHQFLLRHPRQAGYGNAELRERWEGNLVRGWRSVDANLKALLHAADRRANVVVVADHGMIPVHTTVFPNRLLAARGFRVGGPEAQVRAVTSGAGAHLYVNLAGRQPGGVVAASDYPKLVARLVSLFEGLRDPATREPVMEVVARREQMSALRIFHEQTSGDVWLCLKPGYTFSGDDRPGQIFETPRAGGQHGYLASHREMQTIFLVAGPRIRKTPLGIVDNVDAAPTIARIFGVAPPHDAQGRVLEEILANNEKEGRMERLLPGLRAMANIHPLLVHFPIAFLLGALLLEALAVWRRRDDWHRAAMVLLYLGAAGAVAAATSGWFAEETVEHTEASHAVLELHETIMLWTTGLAVTLAVIAFLGGRYLEARRLQVFLLAGLLLVALMLTVGTDRGAQLVYQFGTGVQKPVPATPAAPPTAAPTPAPAPAPGEHQHKH